MSEEQKHGSHLETIHLPASTHWPIVMAFGVTMGVLGLVTNLGVSMLGVVLFIVSAVGWFREVLPHEAHENIPVVVEDVPIETERPHVEQVPVEAHHREHFPVEVYPVLSGIKGGIAGGFAMIPPALIYGYISHGSIWWPVNLLGGAGVANWRNPSVADITNFHWEWLFIACVIQAVVSILVGLLYGAMLPMLPRHPIILGGIVAPVLWTGVIHAILNTINPFLDEHIDWKWFLVSQVIFGLVAGWVVSRSTPKRTSQSLPFIMRMGIEATGLHDHEHEQNHDSEHDGDNKK